MSVAGIYQAAGRSESHPARAIMTDTGGVLVQSNIGTELERRSASDFEYSSAIPGLPVELVFSSGARFIPDDPDYRWPYLTAKQRLPEWLERHWTAVFAAALAVPLFLWFMIRIGIPAAAEAVVVFIPPVISEKMSEQTLTIMDRVMLDPSELPTEQQSELLSRWNGILLQLQMQPDHYQLEFRSGGMPNAFALPDGTVVILDEIVELMQNDPDQLTAVMLHEIGHVHHQHGLKLLSQATATSLLFTMMFGDIEGAGEVLLGAGTSLMQNAFSRDMEREADEYAHEKLQQLGISPAVFGAAMRSLMSAHNLSSIALAGDDQTDEQIEETQDSRNNEWLEYLSSHPDIEERIQAAEDAEKAAAKTRE